MALDVTAVTLIQTNLLNNLINGFSVVTQYALNLLYIFTGFEVVIFGLLWAFQQEAQWGRLFFKVLKIGIIFFIIDHFVKLIGSIIGSFATIGGLVASSSHLGETIFNPALLWKYGYDSSLALLQAGSAANVSVGLSMVQIFLGIGILLCFALLGIQIVLQVVGFYFVSLMGLILLPLGVFSPATSMFEQVISSILKAGVRVAVLLLVVGVATATWHLFQLDKKPISMTINEALGLFDSALLFAYLSMRLPKLVAGVVGRLQLDRLVAQAGSTVYSSAPGGSTVAAAPATAVSVQAAAAVPPPSITIGTQTTGQLNAGNTSVAVSTAAPSVNVSTPIPASAMRSMKSRDKSSMADAYQVNKSVSEDLLNKLSDALKGNQGGLDDRFKDDGR